MDLAAVLEITAAETDVDATLSGSCCFYAAVAAAMAASADLPQKVRKQRGVYAPLFSFWKNSFFFFSLFSSSLSCLITSVFLFLYTFFIYFIYGIFVDDQSCFHWISFLRDESYIAESRTKNVSWFILAPRCSFSSG